MTLRSTCQVLIVTLLVVVLIIPAGSINAIAAISKAKVKHEAPKFYIPGFRINLSADIVDAEGILTARCYFKTQKEDNFIFVKMKSSSKDRYIAELPAPWLNSKSIDYVFVVVNRKKQITRTQVFTMKEEETKAASVWKETQDIEEVRLDKMQEMIEYQEMQTELQVKHRKKLPKHQNIGSGEEISVMTELPREVSAINGFYDNIAVYEVTDGLKYGLLAGDLYTSGQVAAAGGESSIMATTGAASAGTVSAAGGGIGIGMTALVAAGVVGGAAAAVGSAGGLSGSSSGGDDSSGSGRSDGSVTSRNVTISVIDHNSIQDDYYDLYVNGSYIGPVENIPGGTTSYNATLNSGNNTIELRLTDIQCCSTALRIEIDPGGFGQEFSDTKNHQWIIDAP